MTRRLIHFATVRWLVPALLPAAVLAVTPVAEEHALCRQWVESTFGPAAPSRRPYLELVYQDAADGISRGKSWRGTPFRIADQTYVHGIAFNSTKHLRVHLANPGDRFTAAVGLENNDDTQRGATMGHGSVTFHVLVGGKEVLTTPVLRLKDAPRPCDVPLAGATEFDIQVKDGGDGRGWDQALWGEATVTMKDGTRLRLQDLTWAAQSEFNPYTVSFRFAGRPSTGLLNHWPRQVSETELDAVRTGREIRYTDPATGLEVRISAETFRDFPAVEWVAHLRNTTATNLPVIESLAAFDGVFSFPGTGGAVLHWAKGAVASFDDFAPQETALKPGAKLHLQPGGGRSSSQVMPFFNLEGAGGGVIAVIGWSGEWAADFGADTDGSAFLKTGQAQTRIALRPGEEIRTPRMLLLFYQGDRWRGQNLLRRFELAHHRPVRSRQPLVAPITCGNWGGTRAEVHLDNIRRIAQESLPIDYYWIDAEWYGKPGAAGSWAVNVGDWTVKKELYPQGFKPLSDALRQDGRQLMLWFEPERVFKGTPWQREHPDWLLDLKQDSLLFNLGNPAAREFLTRFISDRIDEFGLGCYRQDFNIDPLPFWQAADAPDRQGISEMRHIEGLYAYWDALLAGHPDLILDNCASGGRRLDLETLGRATPFWRTDGPRDAIAHQCHTWGLLPWVPLSATSQDRVRDDYEFRSSMCSALCLNWWVSGDAPAERIPADFPFAWARRTLEQYLELRPFYYGDYYPLTGYSQARDLWMAYQLNRPEKRDGLVVVLRRPDSPYETAQLVLHDLDPAATYRVRNLDTGAEVQQSGRDLLDKGAEVAIAARPGSALIRYERQ